MPEMPDVVAGEPVASDWGNDIRDRTVQRYADAAARDAAVPLPVTGDVAWLDAPNQLTVFDGSVWFDLAAVGDLVAYLPLAGGTMAGNLNFGSGARLIAANGSGSSPAIGFADEPTMGPYRVGAGDYGIVVDGELIQRIGLTRSRLPGVFVDQSASVTNLVRCNGSDGRLQLSTAAVAAVAADDVAAFQSRLPGVDTADLADLIGHLLDRIETLEGA